MSEAPTASDLIEKAFGLARQSGKPDWWAMTIPVLKNRLLLLTKNSFKESAFGATSFRDFLNKLPELVRIDDALSPGFVILKSAEPNDSEKEPPKHVRGDQIRSDLWRAALDYSSGRRYVWDISDQVARPARSSDEGLALPTISTSDLVAWRAEFLELHKPSDPTVASSVEAWSKSTLPTAVLPLQMRPVWNKYLKRKIARRLEEWFETNALTPPDIVEGKQRTDPSEREVETLREFIATCVKAMSKQELLELRISPVTALRALRTRKADSSENGN